MVKKLKIVLSLLTVFTLCFSSINLKWKTAKATDGVEQESPIVLIAGSDFQATTRAKGQENVKEILSAMKADGVDKADGFLFCGDYDIDSCDELIVTTNGVNALLEVVETVVPRENSVLVQGNHDSKIGTAGMSLSGNNDAKNGEYGIFVINEDDYSRDDNPEVVKNTTRAITDYLNDKIDSNYTKPIFILSHIPLHYTLRTIHDKSGLYAKYIFEVINSAGEKGLNIFFLFGHNHGSGWDDYLGGGSVFLTHGDDIIVSENSATEFSTHTLNFTYLNAGYVGYYAKFNDGVDCSLTMTKFEINKNTVVIKRYDKNGLHNLKSKGVRNSYKNEEQYSPNEKVYQSAQTINLTDIKDCSWIDSKVEKTVEINSNVQAVSCEFVENNAIISIEQIISHKLESINFNGEEIDISSIKNGQIVLKARQINRIDANFVENEKYILTENNQLQKGIIIKDEEVANFYAGQIVKFSVQENAGYLLKAVYFNGEEISPDENGKYLVTIIAGDNILNVEYDEIVDEEESVEEQESEFVNESAENEKEESVDQQEGNDKENSKEDSGGSCMAGISGYWMVGMLCVVFATKKIAQKEDN